MKKYFIKYFLYSLWLLVFMLSTNFTHAQQRPLSSLTPVNNFLINPAIAGIEKYVDIKLTSRWQWVNIEGAPRTQFLSVHLPMGNEFITSNVNSSPDDYADSIESLINNYESSESHHGIGLVAYHDEIGAFTRSELSLTYAYHLVLTPKLNVSFGINVGWSLLGIDKSKIRVKDPLDPAILALKTQYNAPNIGAGVWVYGPIFYFGLSGANLITVQSASQGEENDSFRSNVPHLYGTFGFKFPLLNGLYAVPSLVVRKIENLPLSIDLNVKVDIKNKAWVGTGYRVGDAVIFMLGAYINHYLNIGYAYDYTVSDLRNTGGSHEFILGILLNNKYKVRCPSNLW